MKGKVYLVGAGPGDPELLTLKALRVLEQAEVVLYDRLVSPEVLDRVNPLAQMVYVGKEPGQQDRVQEDIFTSMLVYARAGHTVVRLKSGDPMVYGRGAEEWTFLAEQGIEVEVVPGISSALAVPGLAGIPLTLRGVANGFSVLSGQGKAGLKPDFTAYAHSDTLVILMGVKERAQIAHQLIASGRSESEPVAFIENGSTPREHILTATLQDVAQGKTQVASPAVWVVGEVVKVREQIYAQQAAEIVA
ncbi:MAG: uroporphyrinogen-III C-methyltransferase [Thermaceae bacterium]|nr:uroporphyrinogen-III C-methyltransferase [Thermaceae bacterium]